MCLFHHILFLLLYVTVIIIIYYIFYHQKLVAKLEDAHQNLEMVTEGLFSELLTDAVKHIDICRTAVSKIAEVYYIYTVFTQIYRWLNIDCIYL